MSTETDNKWSVIVSAGFGKLQECPTLNQRVLGSSPSAPTNHFKGLWGSCHPAMPDIGNAIGNIEIGTNMEADRDDPIAAQNRWNALALKKGYRCSRCGTTPPYGERELYFETGKCGFCAHVTAKDD